MTEPSAPPQASRDTARIVEAHDDLQRFEAHRPELTALAYRMLGDVARAQDMVQEAWLRWHHRDVEVHNPKGFLLTVVTRLCLNELDSARARLEHRRSDRLPEPVDLAASGLGRLEALEQVSMAFLVLLERLSPVERAVLLLHDVFELEHDDIAPIAGRSAAACRKALERARKKVSAGRRLLGASRAEHERLLSAFLRAATAGDVPALASLLAADAQLVTDGGPEGRVVGRLRNLRRPLQGAERVAAFIAARTQSVALEVEVKDLNGQPALVFRQNGVLFAALLLGVAEGKIERVFFHADLARLGHVGAACSGSAGRRR